jgi:hypothetical protein
MGIGIICEDEECFYTYPFWNDVRVDLAKATLKYLKIIKTTLPKNLDLEDFVAVQPRSLFGDPYKFYCDTFVKYRWILTKNGLEGIFALLDRGETDEEYSIGNCVDIVKGIKTVKHCLEDPDVMESIPEILKVFETGVRLEKNVRVV